MTQQAKQGSYTAAELAACAERELQMRIRVYARRVADGNMRQADADREIGMMGQIRDHYACMDQPALDFRGGSGEGDET